MRIVAVSVLFFVACSNVWLAQPPAPRSFVLEVQAELLELPRGAGTATISLAVPSSSESQDLGPLAQASNGGRVALRHDRFGNCTLSITGAPDSRGPLKLGYRIHVNRYARASADPAAESGERRAPELWIAPVPGELRSEAERLTAGTSGTIAKLRVLIAHLRRHGDTATRTRTLVGYCHALGLAASLESGYRLPATPGRLDTPATWVRVLAPGLGWQAIDLETSTDVGELDKDRVLLLRGTEHPIPARARAGDEDLSASLRTRVSFTES